MPSVTCRATGRFSILIFYLLYKLKSYYLNLLSTTSLQPVIYSIVFIKNYWIFGILNSINGASSCYLSFDSSGVSGRATLPGFLTKKETSRIPRKFRLDIAFQLKISSSRSEKRVRLKSLLHVETFTFS